MSRVGSTRRRGGVAPARDPVLVHVATVPRTLFFVSGQPAYMRERCGLAVHAVASPGKPLSRFAETQRVPVHAVPMARRITPLEDLRAVWRLWRLLRRLRPTIVHAHTPKGGLLGMVAAWLARVPVRVYHLHGSPLLTAGGARRRLLRLTEQVSCALAHRVLSVSHSVERFVVAERLCAPAKIKVLGSGSINGVDAEGRFRPATASARQAARARRGIPADARVVGYVGRLAREKGIAELADAWQRVRERDPLVHLVLVGELDRSDPPPAGAVATLLEDPRVQLVEWVSDTSLEYAGMDVVALPTYREGFTTVALEAAAMALPIVATRVAGCVDAVQDGVTGTLVPPRDAGALASALGRYLGDPALRRVHGDAARRRVLAEFRRERLWEALATEYQALLGAAGVAARRGSRGARQGEAAGVNGSAAASATPAAAGEGAAPGR